MDVSAPGQPPHQQAAVPSTTDEPVTSKDPTGTHSGAGARENSRITARNDSSSATTEMMNHSTQNNQPRQQSNDIDQRVNSNFQKQNFHSNNYHMNGHQQHPRIHHNNQMPHVPFQNYHNPNMFRNNNFNNSGRTFNNFGHQGNTGHHNDNFRKQYVNNHNNQNFSTSSEQSHAQKNNSPSQNESNSDKASNHTQNEPSSNSENRDSRNFNNNNNPYHNNFNKNHYGNDRRKYENRNYYNHRNNQKFQMKGINNAAPFVPQFYPAKMPPQIMPMPHHFYNQQIVLLPMNQMQTPNQIEEPPKEKLVIAKKDGGGIVDIKSMKQAQSDADTKSINSEAKSESPIAIHHGQNSAGNYGRYPNQQFNNHSQSNSFSDKTEKYFGSSDQESILKNELMSKMKISSNDKVQSGGAAKKDATEPKNVKKSEQRMTLESQIANNQSSRVRSASNSIQASTNDQKSIVTNPNHKNSKQTNSNQSTNFHHKNASNNASKPNAVVAQKPTHKTASETAKPQTQFNFFNKSANKQSKNPKSISANQSIKSVEVSKILKAAQPVPNSPIGDVEVNMTSLLQTSKSSEEEKSVNILAKRISFSDASINNKVQTESPYQNSISNAQKVTPVPVEPKKPMTVQQTTPAVSHKKPVDVLTMTSYSVPDFCSHKTIVAVQECYSKLPIIFRKLSSKKIQLTKVSDDTIDSTTEKYNPNAELSHADQILRSVRSDLNRLTEKNIGDIARSLVAVIKKVAFDEEIINNVASIIFYKAIADSKFLPQHADLISNYAKENMTTLVLFIKANITQNISHDVYNQEKLDKKKAEIEQAANTADRDRLKDDYDLTVKKQEVNYTNTVKLFSYLYMKEFFTVDEVFKKFEEMLKSNSLPKRDGLCAGLAILGPRLSKVESCKERIDAIYDSLHAISEDPSTPNKFKFKIQALIENRNKEPKTIGGSGGYGSKVSNREPFKKISTTGYLGPGSAQNTKKSEQEKKHISNYQIGGNLNDKNAYNPSVKKVISEKEVADLTERFKVQMRNKEDAYHIVKLLTVADSKIKEIINIILELVVDQKQQDMLELLGKHFGYMLFLKNAKLEHFIDEILKMLDQDGDWLVEVKRLPSMLAILVAEMIRELYVRAKKTNLPELQKDVLIKIIDVNKDLYEPLDKKSLESHLQQLFSDEKDALKEIISQNHLESSISI